MCDEVQALIDVDDAALPGPDLALPYQVTRGIPKLPKTSPTRAPDLHPPE